MEKRSQDILSAIVEEYTKTAIPVGSSILFDKYDLRVSSATIRNEMAGLEDEGYLYQPHISSGRIPTDKGYRFFVEQIMGDKMLTLREQQNLQKEFLKLKAQNQRLTRTTARLMSHLSGNLAISGLIGKDEFYEFGVRDLLSEPEFKDMDEVCRLAEVLDYIDERFDNLVKEIGDDETRIYIGDENPLEDINSCSMIVSPYKTKTGEKGVLALIGPKRMKYAKNKSIIEYVKKMLGGSMIIIVFINFI